MTLRKGHGNGAGVPRIEVMPADELPDGVPAPPALAPERADRRFVKGSVRTAAAARAGGLAKARRNPMAAAKSLGLGQALIEFATDPRIQRFVDDGERWFAQALAGLARDVGGGELSAEVVSIVQGASWQRVYSQFLFDLSSRAQFAWSAEEQLDSKARKKIGVRANTQTILTASRLAESHRQSMLAAFELAAREAAARKTSGHDVVAEIKALAQARADANAEEGDDGNA